MQTVRGKGVFADAPLDYLYLRDRYSWIRRHILHFSFKRAIRRSLEKGWGIYAADRQIALEIHRYYKVPLERITVSTDPYNLE